ncbi:MAG: acetate--CoA ligase family protein [Betaproteobacteria bacterium]|nr:acetate--CoA ligase family protein [Betaproteobacteria bacterium]
MDQSLNASARNVQDFSRLVNPRAVAVVGASNDLSRIGGQPLKLLTEFGFKGKVYPVNPKYPEIKGLTCYKDIASVPKPCDVALVALSSNHVLSVIEQLGAAGIPFAIVLSAGFSEVGGEGIELQRKLVETAKRAGVRLIGPNCLGMLNLHDNARIGFGGTVQLKTLIPGPCAMVTQSGGFGFGVVATAAYYGVGFNYAISTGNEADISMLELAEFFLERKENDSIMLFMEGITDGRRLIALGERALELGKPVLVWKVGNTDVGRQAAASHTARMTASYELFQSAFRHGGFIEVRDMDDLIDVMKVQRTKRVPKGNRVGVITLSGGAGVLIADRCIEHGLDLPKLTDPTTAQLKELVVSYASVANPVDATANGYNDAFASYNRVIAAVIADPNIDQVIARSPRGSAAPAWSRAFIEIANATDKPVILNWPTSPDDNADVMKLLEENNVPCILSPGRTVRALASLNEFAQKQQAHAKRPRKTATRPTEKQALNLPAGSGTLGEHRSKQALAAYGIPVVKEVLLSADDVAKLKEPPLPFPLVVKIESADIPHKTEAGVVRLNIRTLDELNAAARDVLAAANKHDSKARIDGVLVQEMASGLEVLIGAVNDRFFGPVVVFGLGGIYTELLKDITRRFAPFDEATAREMIDDIKSAALLHGFRGQPALDVDALAAALSRVSLLIADHADRIAEIDVNPIFVHPAGQGVVAADALVVLKDKA